MQGATLAIFLTLSSSLLFTNVGCAPNHHHNNHNDFPWQNILSSLGIVIKNETSITSTTEANDDGATFSPHKERYTSESTVGALQSDVTEGIETPVVQNGTTLSSTTYYAGNNLGVKVGVPIASIIIFILFWYCVCKCCCACCEKEQPGVVVMQTNTVHAPPPAPAPQIILQQPIVHQHAAPMYDASQRWAQPPHHGPPQWGQPMHEPPQWAPHPMGQQQHYSPSGGHEAYDNPNFNPATAPPPYNTGKY